MNETTSTLYEQVVGGLSEECSQVVILDKMFISFVSHVRSIEDNLVGSATRADWEREWNRIESLASEIHAHAANVRKRLERPAPESDPLAEWMPVVTFEDEIDALLANRRATGSRLVGPGKLADWEAGWVALETCISKLRVQVRSVQVKLELQRDCRSSQLSGRARKEQCNNLDTILLLRSRPKSPENLSSLRFCMKTTHSNFQDSQQVFRQSSSSGLQETEMHDGINPMRSFREGRPDRMRLLNSSPFKNGILKSTGKNEPQY